MALPLTEAADFQLQLTAHLSLAWLVDYSIADGILTYKWSPVSYRSSAGQGKFADQRPTLYHCATQPTTTSPYDAMMIYIATTNAVAKHMCI